MGRRKNTTKSCPQMVDPVERTEKGDVLAATRVQDVDDPSAEKEDKMFEKLSKSTELLLEVLSRLAPQTLFRFMGVSKGWCNLIRQADFAARHHRNCTAIAGRAITGLFFQNNEESGKAWYWRSNGTHFITVEAEAGRVPDPSLEFLKQKGNSDVVQIVDSCNGLLLCCNTTWGSNFKTCFVCNPLTKDKVGLPNPRKPSSRVSYALMADLEGNYLKYGVLCLVRPKSCGQAYSKLLILSSETGEWRELDDKLPPVSCEFVNGSKVFFNGSLYWDCLEGHILVCHLNVKQRKPCYKLIGSPRAPLGRCLWKSQDKLHCYCHGFGDEFPEWTLRRDGGEEFKWQLEDSEKFRDLTDDVSGLYSDLWTIERKAKPRIQFKIISYAPESKTLFLLIPSFICTYQFTERRLEVVGGCPNFRGRRFDSEYRALPYVHTLLPFQKKAEHGEAERDIGKAIQTLRVNNEAETGVELKKVRGRRNKRTPRCQDYSIEV